MLLFLLRRLMKINQAIDRVDSLKPNQFTPEQKMLWLSELDARIYNDLFLTHEENPLESEEEEDGELVDTTPKALSPYEDMEVELLAPFPYDCMYISYLQARIDEYNEETSRYANSAAMFNAQYDDYARFYNRTHMPIGERANNAFPRHY